MKAKIVIWLSWFWTWLVMGISIIQVQGKFGDWVFLYIAVSAIAIGILFTYALEFTKR